MAATATPSASYSDIYAARLSALNDGASRMERLETRQPWIDENLNPYTGDWIARTLLKQRRQAPDERGKDYNHSTFCDLVITGLVGLRPRADEVDRGQSAGAGGNLGLLLPRPRALPRADLTILYDRTGERYRPGQRVAGSGRWPARRRQPVAQRVTGKLP